MKRTNSKSTFLTAVRGIPTHHVIAALNTETPGINWTGSSKADIGEHFDDALRRDAQATYPRLASVSMTHLAMKAQARADGFMYWREIDRIKQFRINQRENILERRVQRAAPDLLAALQAYIEADDAHFPLATREQVRQQARDAVNKARFDTTGEAA